MRQSNNNNKCARDRTAFIYVRLSRDDELEGESYSISNQKKLLTKVAKDKGYTNIVVFCDDGISGVTMNRPEFNKMIEQIQLGKAAAVFIKDLSRLGRNYIEVGRLTEEFFPEHNIRLVSVSDNLDTEEGESELVVNDMSLTIGETESKTLKVSAKVMNGATSTIETPTDVTFTVANDKIVTMDENGVVTATGVGTTTITVKGTVNGKELTKDITVTVDFIVNKSIE